MKLSENPIFITQKRLVHRSGVLAAVLIAALLGLSLLSGLIAYLASPRSFNFDSPQDAGRLFYGWVVGIETLILVFGGFSRVSRALGDDRKAGLWDSNRLTPLRPQQLVAGYWFGAGLREFYMAVVLAVIGLLIVLLGKLSITLWLGTQILILSTAFLAGLVGILFGLAFERPQGILAIVPLLFLYPFVFLAPSRMLTNFLLPIYGNIHLFQDPEHPGHNHEWLDTTHIFGVPVPPVLITVTVQLLVGIFLWRAVVRKTARPFEPLLQRWEAIALFAILIFFQHGLLWDIWRGHYPENSQPNFYEGRSILAIIHGATLFVAILILTSASPLPEAIRLESLRRGTKDTSLIFSRSALSLAVALAVISSIGIFTHCMFSLGESLPVVVATAINLVEMFVVFTLVLEFCRVRHRRRAVGFVALWLFILWALPFIFAGVFANSGFGKMSLLSPGFLALGDREANWWLMFLTELAHFGIVVVFFGVWLRQWKRLLGQAPPPPLPTSIPAAIKN